MKLEHLLVESSFLTGKDKIIDWVVDNAYLTSGEEIPVSQIEVGSDGRVTMKCGIELHLNTKELRVSFKSVKKKYDASFALLKSFDGSPEEIVDDDYVGDGAYFNGTMTKLDGITKRACHISIGACTKIESLKGIHRHIEKCEHIEIPISVNSDMLGLILIDGLRGVMCSHRATPRLKRAIAIVNDNLGKGRAGIVQAQRKMIDAGLDKYAGL